MHDVVRSRTRAMVTASLLAALMAASAWIAIPTPWGVPFTLQVLVVVLIALLLRPSWAAGAVAVYLLVGAAGLPVFSGGKGGIGVLVGPTGGYLLGFVAGAWLGSLTAGALARGARTAWSDATGAVVAIAVVYAAGWLQLAAVAGLSLGEAAALGVAPYLLADAAKAAVAVPLASAVRRAAPRVEGALAR